MKTWKPINFFRCKSRWGWGLFSVLMLGTLLLAGCGKSDESTSQVQEKKRPVIAVIPKGTAHVFWQAVHSGAVTAGKEFDVEIQWQGPQTETMKEQQASIVSDFLVKQVDGIVLAPQDQDALAPVVERVALQKIPLVIFDSGINSENYLSFVATDNYQGGVMAARHMGRLLNGKGTVIITKVDPGSDSTINRENGFEEILAKEFPEIKVVGSAYGYSDREKSRAATDDLLIAHPDVDGIFGPNESSTFGVLLALQARELVGKKKFVGFDSSDELVDAMRKNEIDVLILQNPFKMGYEGVKAIVRHLNGEEVPRRIDTGVYAVTPDNMDEPENKNLLIPDLSILQEG
ncbi:MAG: sugar ABC transporter substrate-binding protein [Candidatus Omnitrophota bacterium]|nr:MAG: sugar ABC transporter substrate-binding protein [Candidatus Omnitrophota bacterium]